MELIYIWIEKHKNIKNQGFNFSSKLYCEHHPNNKETILHENKEYLANFFDENINITAIVGKNGCGKSAILECLSATPSILIVLDDDKIKTIGNTRIINLTKHKLSNKKLNPQALYIPSPDYLLNNINLIGGYENSKKHPNNALNYAFNVRSDEIYSIKNHTINNQLEMFLHSKNKLNDIIFPKNIVFSIELYQVESTNKKDFSDTPLSEIIYLWAYKAMTKIIDHTNKKTEKPKKIETPNENNAFGDIFNKIFSKDSTFDRIVTSHLNKSKNTQISTKELFLEFRSILNNQLYIDTYLKVQKYCSFFEDYNDIYPYLNDESDYEETSYRIPLNRFNKEILNVDVLASKNEVPFIKCKWEKTFSSGENSILNLFSLLFCEINKNQELTLICIDEGESFLHPNWQKRYLSYLVKFISSNFPNRKFHFILSSHSPFILSDIPRQYVIFLDSDKDGNCAIVNGLNEKQETFGANIHTLLSDSFFMENDLMGHFAKSKISEIINFYKDAITGKECNYEALKAAYMRKMNQFWKIHSIIGEKYLQQIIHNHLIEIEKILFGKDEAKSLEIHRVKNYLHRLEND